MSDDDRQAEEEILRVLRRLEAAPRDPEAWERFFLRLWPYVLATTHRSLAGSPQGVVDAEDVAQETFIQFARYWHTHKERRPRTEVELRALLGVMARRQCSASRRLLLRERRDARRDRPLPPDGNVMEVRPVAQALVEYRDLLEAIRGDLQPNEVQVLDLLIDGHTEIEIAKGLGVTDRTIRRWLTAVREVIRKRLLQWNLG